MDLTLLKQMLHSPEAGFLSGDRQGCLKGTRRDVISEIEQWLVDKQGRRLFWLNGLAGTGKSTIAQTFAKESFAYGKLGASFFCSRAFPDRSTLKFIFPTLAYQLAHKYPSFRKELLQVLRTSHDVEHETLSSQFEKIILRPLTKTKIPTLIIIDALDECQDKEPASALLTVLSRLIHQIPDVKFFITGRPEPSIEQGFRLESLRHITRVLELHNVDRSLVDGDIRLYLRVLLSDIRRTRSDCEYPEDWPSSWDINNLCGKANGLFIYASTVVKFIESKYHSPSTRLNLIIFPSKDVSHEVGIDNLYTQILELAFQDAGTDEQDLYVRFRNVVGTVLLVFHPLSRKALSDLVPDCRTPSYITITLRFLHSLLKVQDNEDKAIEVLHKSFPDFLTNEKRCKDKRFFVDPAINHEEILFSCLELMKRLRRNICGLDDYAVLTKVDDLSAHRDKCIGSSLEYACRFWTRHLENVPAGGGSHVKQIKKAIDEFFTKHLLCWLEVLSITGHLGEAVYAINRIRKWYISVSCTWTRSCMAYPHAFPLDRHPHLQTGRRQRASHSREF